MLAACGGGGGTATPTSAVAEPAGPEEQDTQVPAAEEPTSAPEASACGAVQLEYWNPFTGPDGPFMGEMVDAFNAEHPDIQVTMTSQGEYYTQLSTAAAAGTLPEVAIVHADQVATQAFRNVLRPIDDLVTEMAIEGSDFPEAVWAAGEVAGKRYSIPLDIHPMTMFYNADMLSAAGIDEGPTNSEEFEAAANAVMAADHKGFDLTGGFPAQQIFQTLLHQFGGSEFNAKGTEAIWNSEAGVQALQWMKDAQATWSEPNLEVNAELAGFKNGTVAMIWNGIWQIPNVTADAVGFDGRATAVPQIGPEMAVWAGSHHLTLPEQSTVDPCKDKAAIVFINYLLDNSVTWAKIGQIPASNTVRGSTEFLAFSPQADIAPSVEFAIFPPSVPGITDAFEPLSVAVDSVMNGSATDIQATLNEAAARANEIIQENAATYGEVPAAP